MRSKLLKFTLALTISWLGLSVSKAAMCPTMTMQWGSVSATYTKAQGAYKAFDNSDTYYKNFTHHIQYNFLSASNAPDHIVDWPNSQWDNVNAQGGAIATVSASADTVSMQLVGSPGSTFPNNIAWATAHGTVRYTGPDTYCAVTVNTLDGNTPVTLVIYEDGQLIFGRNDQDIGGSGNLPLGQSTPYSMLFKVKAATNALIEVTGCGFGGLNRTILGDYPIGTPSYDFISSTWWGSLNLSFKLINASGWFENNTWSSQRKMNDVDTVSGTPSPNPYSATLSANGQWFSTGDTQGPTIGGVDNPDDIQTRPASHLGNQALGDTGGGPNKRWFDYPRNTQTQNSTVSATERTASLIYQYPSSSSNPDYKLNYQATETLDTLYTTTMFVADAIAATKLLPVTMSGQGAPPSSLASVQLSTDEDSVTVTSASYQYKFKGKLGEVYHLSWTERYTAADGTTSDQLVEETAIGTGEYQQTTAHQMSIPSDTGSATVVKAQAIPVGTVDPSANGADNTALITVSGIFTSSHNPIFDFSDSIDPNSTHIASGLKSVSTISDLLRTAIDTQLQNNQHVIVAGHSMGSLAAYNVQSEYQGKDVRFVYIDPPYKGLPCQLIPSMKKLGQGLAQSANKVNWTGGSAFGPAFTHFPAHDPFDFPGTRSAQEKDALKNLLSQMIDDPTRDGTPDDGSMVECSTCQNSQTTLNSVNFSLSLGRNLIGESAGQLSLSTITPDPSILTPAALELDASQTNGVTWTTANGVVTSITAPEMTLTITATSPSSFTIAQYYPTNNTPYSVWTISSPDNGASVNITNSLGSKTIASHYTWIAGNNNWQLDSGNGLRRETKVTSIDQLTGNETDTYTIADPTQPSTISSKTVYHFVNDSIRGKLLVSSTVDPDGAALTTQYGYDTDAGINYGKPSYYQPPTGPSVTYAYDNTSGCLLSKTLSNGRQTVYSYNSVDSRDPQGSYPLTPRIISEYYGGNLYARTYRINTANQKIVVQVRNPVDNGTTGDLSGTSNLVTTTTLVTTGDGRFIGLPSRVDLPDGTSKTFSYQIINNQIIETIDQGAFQNGSISAGTRMVLTSTLTGHSISVSIYDAATMVLLDSENTTSLDPEGRPLAISYLDGTSAQYNYNCCGLESQINRDGSWIAYQYDDLHRNTAITTPAVLDQGTPLTEAATLTYNYSYDTAGRVLSVNESTSDNHQRLIGQYSYNLAGQETQVVGPLSTFNISTVKNQDQTVTVTKVRQDTGDNIIELYNSDGTLNSITGTLVHPRSYTYGYDYGRKEMWVQEDAFDANYQPGGGGSTASIRIRPMVVGNYNDNNKEWAQSFFDALGNVTEIQYGSPGNPSDRYFYNQQGQLANSIEKGVSTLYTYNNQGRIDITAVDLVGDGQLHLDQTNRAYRTVSDVIVDGLLGAAERVQLFAWTENNNSTPQLVAEALKATTGLGSRTTVWNEGIPVTTTKTLTPTGSLLSSVTTNSDNSVTTEKLIYDKVYETSITGAHGLKYHHVFNYNSFGDLAADTDQNSLDGTTLYVYDATGALSQKSTPAATAGQPKLTTSYLYNSSGLTTQITLPDNSTQTFAYYPSGDLLFSSGSQQTTAGYAYDLQGRVTATTNWITYPQTFTVTQWNRDPSSGLTSSQQLPDPSSGQPGQGSQFTYYTSKMLASQTLARNLTINYSYNLANDLVREDFSDGSPSVVFTYDRLGHQTQVTVNGQPQVQRSFDILGNLQTETYLAGPNTGSSIFNTWQAPGAQRTQSAFAGSNSGFTNTYTVGAGVGISTITSGDVSLTNAFLPGTALINATTVNSITASYQYDNLQRINIVNTPAGVYSYGRDLLARTTTEGYNNESWQTVYAPNGSISSYSKKTSNISLFEQQFGYYYNDDQTLSSWQVDGVTGSRVTSVTRNAASQITSLTSPPYLPIVGLANEQATITVNDLPTKRQQGYYAVELPVDNRQAGVISVTNRGILHATTNSDLQAVSVISRFVPSNGEQFSYDADGNILSDDRWVYTWNIKNQLINLVSLSDSPIEAKQQWTFQYDDLGRRNQITKSLWQNGNWVVSYAKNLVYDGQHLIAEVNATNNAIIRSYVWNNEAPAWVVDYANNVTNCIIADPAHSVRALVNLAGKVTATYDYSPQGVLLRETGGAGYSPLRYHALYQDSETGWLFESGQYYRPQLGMRANHSIQ